MRRSRAPETSRPTSGSATMSATRIRGSSELSGSWKTICTSRRNQRSSCGRPGATGRPPNVTVPARGPIESEQDASERRLAGAGLADDAERVPDADCEADAGEGVALGPRSEHGRARQAVHAADVLGDEQRVGHVASSTSSCSSGKRRLPRGGNELGGVRILRLLDEAGGRPALDDHAVAHHDDIVGDGG